MNALRSGVAFSVVAILIISLAGCGSDKTSTPQNQQLTKERQDKIGARKAQEEANQGGQ
jgi:uncharacterized lipoprotein YehR (DUF1307 family)